jgi:hypothetical protein
LFDLDVEDGHNTGIVTVGRHTVSKDAYAFSDRLKQVTQVRGERKIRELFLTLLRSSTLIWHSTELSDMERDLLQIAPIDRICAALIRRFKEQTAVAMTALATKRFTMADIRPGKNLRGFAQAMMMHAKAAEMTLVYNQLLAV